MSIVWNASPVSMTELGIYLDWRKNLQGTAYNIPFLFPLPEGTDGDRLENALTQTLRAHPNLLSHFRMAADGSVSRLTPEAEDGEIPVTVRKEIGEPELKNWCGPSRTRRGICTGCISSREKTGRICSQISIISCLTACPSRSSSAN